MTAEETRTHILEAAAAIFARDGFAGAHVAEIAEEAGANVALIYRYFGSKEGLLDALLEGLSQAGRERRHDLFEGEPLPSTAEQLDQLARRDWEVLRPYRDILKIALFESIKGEDPETSLMRVFDEGVLSRFPHAAVESQDDRAVQLKLAAFFFGFIPFMNFLVFAERWAIHMGLDPEQVQEAFFTVNREFYAENIIARLNSFRDAERKD
jgi:AcrR family transcriptional regulator